MTNNTHIITREIKVDLRDLKYITECFFRMFEHFGLS